ncbi:putative transcription factor WD40-like family [Lupinus albus]|uniref:Putative transcription factor WD40-like family n=1 Tax=Lupinus albus TaxID=3870 RepID=A0A6A4Q8H5_LUPAL|nr:putative transcription factor WD40-like family [Lupinus albus]
MLFSDDNSLLISASDDGTICVWSMISLLDVEESRSLPCLLHCLLGHMSTITGLLTLHGSCSSVLVSSSLDGTCKVWDIISGKLMQSQVYSLPITSIALDHGNEFLFYGIVNGKIIVNKLNIGLEEGPTTFGQTFELKGHSGPITALTSSQAGLISGSEDCTICIWDVINRTIIRRFNLQKGKVTNLVVVMRSSMLSRSKSNHKKVSNQYIVSPLDKCSEPYNSMKGATTLVSLCGLYKENQSSIDLRSACLLRQYHTSFSQGQKAEMSMAMTTQMKVETNIEQRMWAIEMTKHIMRINKQLKSQLLGMIQSRLCCLNINNDLQKTSIKKLKFETLLQEDEGEKP